MKTLKQIKEEYDNITLSQLPEAPEDLMLEGRENTKQSNRLIPSFSQMPTMLLFRRVAYRLYPNKQVVALYYSKLVDKYLSVPYGPDGNLNLSESSVYNTYEEMELEEGAKWEATKGALKGALHGTIRGGAIGGAIAPGPGTAIGAVVGGVRGAYKGAKSGYEKGKNMEEDWQSVNRHDKTDGLSQKAVNAYRRENPGSKLKTAVTEKNPTGKRASRRKSFCSRMGGMKKRLTSAKTARDPDSRINKALRRWNCEEDFKLKLAQLREDRQIEQVDEGVEQVLKYAKPFVKPAYDAGKRIAKNLMSKLKPKTKEPARNADAMKRSSKDSKPSKSTTGDLPDVPVNPLTKAVDDSAKSTMSALSGAITKSRTDLIHDKPAPKSYSGFGKAKSDDEVFHSRYKASLTKEFGKRPATQTQQNENNIADIRNMINEGTDTMNLQINGRTVTLNTSMAKRILEVYDSVNTKNKKIVESMLNEDLESFKKLLNFSIKV